MVLKNQRHERFAQLVASGSSLSAAYRDAGYTKKNAGSQAHRLSKNANVAERIAEIKAEIAKQQIAHAVVTRTWVKERLKENAIVAAAKGEYSASNRALELLGKEIGMFVEPAGDRIRELAEMSDEQIDQLAREAEREELALRAPASSAR